MRMTIIRKVQNTIHKELAQRGEANARKKRRSSLQFRDGIDIGIGRAVEIRGYDPSGNFVCRLEISNAGVEVFSGTKGGKCLCKLTWEGLVNTLGN
jgi:hypothetical protein